MPSGNVFSLFYLEGFQCGGDYFQVTTDLRQGCTGEHSGTSASAPIVAGIVALTLEAK